MGSSFGMAVVASIALSLGGRSPKPFLRRVRASSLGAVARCKRYLVVGAFLSAAVSVTPLAAATPTSSRPAFDSDLARAQALLDEGNTEQAVELLDGYLRKHPKQADALLLRSTGRFVLGDRLGGAEDLNRCLELDSSLRQAWLNKGALDLSEANYEGAIEAFGRAKELAPEAPDSDLNLSVAYLLSGDLKRATLGFEAYLKRADDLAEAYYLVASNFSMAGYETLSVRHLEEAIRLDERMRLRARTDPNFQQLASGEALQAVLNTDLYQPPPGAYSASHSFEQPYEIAEGKLLGAVVDALRGLSMPFSPHIEVTPSWAILWGEQRIKVHGNPGLVEVTAEASSFTPSEWQSRVQRLFARIEAELSPTLPQLPGRGR